MTDITPQKIQGYGWRPDLPDARDLKYATSTPLAPSVDLSANLGPVLDQGQLGSCVANALVGHVLYNQIKDGLPHVQLSRLFLYWYARWIEGTSSTDSGCAIRDAMRVLTHRGDYPETAWPYHIDAFWDRPPTAWEAKAEKDVFHLYSSLTTVDNFKACLSEGYPFVIGISVYESFESAAVAQSGSVPMPVPSEQLLGGHAVLCYGYDADTWLCRNSWGAGWGDGGNFTLPAAYLDPASGLADDAWTLRSTAITQTY